MVRSNDVERSRISVRATHNVRILQPMSKTSPKSASSGFPEFAVGRETISKFFDPPLARSTFYDFVNKGMIVPLKGIRGFFRLNDSLRRLGLREVPHPPREATGPSTEDLVRLAFNLIDPLLFPDPPWILTAEVVNVKDVDHALLLAQVHRENVEALESSVEKLAYFGGVLDCQAMIGLQSED